MNFTALESYIFFVRRMAETHKKMKEDFLEDKDMSVLNGKAQHDTLYARAKKEKSLIFKTKTNQ